MATAFFMLLFAVIVGRLVQVQVLQADRFEETSVAQRARTIELPATRGRIYDRNGSVLAASVDSATLWADPRAYRPRTLEDGTVVEPAVTPAQAAARLAGVLDIDRQLIQRRLASDAHFVYIARQVDWELGEQVLALDLPGVGRLTEPRRDYPSGALGAQILGFTGIDGEGLEGLELGWDRKLAGRTGTLAIEQAENGLTIAPGLRELTPTVAGTDVVLTIDRDIQAAAEQAAARTVADHSAQAASVVVLDVDTGDILAMATSPGFDPTDRSGTDGDDRRNRALTDVYEPGSIQKALTVAAALEEGVIDEDTVLSVPAEIIIANEDFTDDHRPVDEDLSITEIVALSSNVGTIKIAQRLGEDRLHEYLERFGVTSSPELGFPGETAGIVPAVENWSGTSLPTIAIGHGVATSVMHNAQVYATIANDGVRVEPRLVRGTIGSDGELEEANPSDSERVLSADTAATVRRMLEQVVTHERGTGRKAAIAGHRVGGKTGTARKVREDGRGYTNDHVATFVGMAPIDDPELVVAVLVDEPVYGYYGGTAAAPLFAEVMEFSLRNRQVPISDPQAVIGDFDEASLRARVEAANAAAREAARQAAREAPKRVDEALANGTD